MKTIRNIQDFPDKFSDICSGQMPKECDTDDYFDKGTICAEADDVSGKKNSAEFVPLKFISAQQNIPLKYLESITTILSKKKLVEATSGKGGGYRLFPLSGNLQRWGNSAGGGRIHRTCHMH